MPTTHGENKSYVLLTGADIEETYLVTNCLSDIAHVKTAEACKYYLEQCKVTMRELENSFTKKDVALSHLHFTLNELLQTKRQLLLLQLDCLKKGA